MNGKWKIVGLGEALFDVFQDREVLGGAPLNVAVQAHALASQAELGQGIVASRIGDDELGARIRQDLASRDMTTEWLQTDPSRPTGTVQVTIDDGEPHYEIVRDVAWDALEAEEELLQLADACHAVCFGSLAQRSDPSRQAIRAFLARATNAIRLFDVNLRQQFFDAEILARSCELATVVKLNEKELPRVMEMLGEAGLLPDSLPESSDEATEHDWQARVLREAFSLDALVLTQGKAGTAIYDSTGKTTGEPVSYEFDDYADSVGAGDACSAGVLIGMLLRWPAEQTVKLANHLGAYVASQPGATPELPVEITCLLKSC